MSRRRVGDFNHFDWLAPIYDRVIQPADTERLKSLADLQTTDRLLDVGGGTGRAVARLGQAVARTWVLDLSRSMLQRTADKVALRPCQGSVAALPFATHAFDKVLAVDSFHHFADQAGAARELLRVLAPGGRLVIEEPDIRRFPVKLVALGEQLALMKSRFRPAEDVVAIFSSPDTIVRVVAHSPNYWVVVTNQAH